MVGIPHHPWRKRLLLGTSAAILLTAGAWEGGLILAPPPEVEPVEDPSLRLLRAGRTLYAAGSFEEAIAQFDQALLAKPDSWEAHFERGRAWDALHRNDAALADLRAALHAKPDLVDAYQLCAAIYEDQGDLPHALEQWIKVIQLRPGADAYFHRGLVYASLGRHESAIADFTWVLEKAQNPAGAREARARSKRAVGDEAGAATDEAATE
jgi:tetratricopeptide (TPR) repeat protein